MAILRDDKIELEITYKDFEHGWVQYDIACRWDGVDIFNDLPLKRHSDYWETRRESQFLVNEADDCCFLPFFDKLFEKKQPAYLTPIEPDFTLGVWPRDIFPFQPSNMTLIYMADSYREEQEAREVARKAAGGVLDDDDVQLIMQFDGYQYRHSSYLGSGPAIHMRPAWQSLKQFAEDLRQEFAAFAAHHHVFEKLSEEADDEVITWWQDRMSRPFV